MPVIVVSGDLFQSQAQTLTNAVNCAGVMGKGIALEFKRRFPAMVEDYVRRCEMNEIRLGVPYVYSSTDHPWILNFPTKQHWRSKSKLDAIVAGLDYLTQHYQTWGVSSLAVPALGCGLGQLDWDTVKPIMLDYLGRMSIPIELYAPL
ncbi:MAG: macro domain-containing protein [Anaerolineae bacterium]|nr:macro domain-containing protein [Anaerolineae bacterium]